MPKPRAKKYILEGKLVGSSWQNRGTYGRILKKIILKQVKRFQETKEQEKAIQIAHNIGYLSNILNTIIKDEENSQLEKRIEELERKVGI